MSAPVDIGGTFRGVVCGCHLPDESGAPTLGGNADGLVFLGVRAFADANLDSGPAVHVALQQRDADDGEAAIMPLSLSAARHFLKCLTEALAEAEKLQ